MESLDFDCRADDTPERRNDMATSNPMILSEIMHDGESWWNVWESRGVFLCCVATLAEAEEFARDYLPGVAVKVRRHKSSAA
jgi:hypothetical protein